MAATSGRSACVIYGEPGLAKFVREGWGVGPGVAGRTEGYTCRVWLSTPARRRPARRVGRLPIVEGGALAEMGAISCTRCHGNVGHYTHGD